MITDKAARPLDVIDAMRQVKRGLLTGAPLPPTWLTRDGAVRDIEQRIRDISEHVVRHGNEWHAR